MTNLLSRIQKLKDDSEEILSVKKIPIKELSEEELEVFSPEEARQSAYVISVLSSRESADLENLLLKLDVLFFVNTDKKNQFLYTFLNYYENYKPFTFENALQSFKKFCRKNKELLNKSYFGLDLFNELKEDEIIPYNYELYATTKSPEDMWDIEHYIVYKDDTPVFSKSVDDVFSNIESWAKELFLKIEEIERN